MGLADADLHERLEDLLMGEGIYVTNFARRDGDIHIGYETTASEGIPHREIGRILTVLIEAREDGWEPCDVHGWVYDLDRSEGAKPRGHWEAREGWFHALAEGDLSETDFSTLVLSTVG
jgi:hypothetical protein